ncbi:phage holin family protein, partial [bacterium RCC_150]
MSEAQFPPTPAQAKADTTSLGDLLGEVTRDLSTL